MSKLVEQHCHPIDKSTAPLSVSDTDKLLREIHEWQAQENRAIVRTFKFKDFYETMAFVNAVAFIAHQQDHHPDMNIGYNRCKVCYSTHSIGGLSINDFICAAHIDHLLSQT